MTEQKLKEYFENLLTAEQLAEDVKGSQKKESHNVTSVYINPIISSEQFQVKKEHLIKLCRDTIAGKLEPIDLNTISFALISSEYFSFGEETPEGEIISNVIYDWDNPEIGFDLTMKNVELWQEYLLTGNYKLNFEELKRKNLKNNTSS